MRTAGGHLAGGPVSGFWRQPLGSHLRGELRESTLFRSRQGYVLAPSLSLPSVHDRKRWYDTGRRGLGRWTRMGPHLRIRLWGRSSSWSMAMDRPHSARKWRRGLDSPQHRCRLHRQGISVPPLCLVYRPRLPRVRDSLPAVAPHGLDLSPYGRSQQVTFVPRAQAG